MIQNFSIDLHKTPTCVAQDNLLNSPIICYADEVEDLLHVEGNKPIAAPLGKEPNNGS